MELALVYTTDFNRHKLIIAHKPLNEMKTVKPWVFLYPLLICYFWMTQAHALEHEGEHKNFYMSAGLFYAATTNPTSDYLDVEFGGTANIGAYTEIETSDEGMSANTYEYTGKFEGNTVGNIKAKPQSTLIKLGYSFNQYISIELRFAGMIGGSPKETTIKTELEDPDEAHIYRQRTGIAPTPEDQRTSGTVNPIADDNNPTINANVSMDNFYGLFVRTGIHTWKLYPYAILGYTQAQISSELESITFERIDLGGRGDQAITIPASYLNTNLKNTSVSDFSYGIGIDYYLEENFAVNLEYMSYLRDSALEIDGLNLSLTYTFR